MNPRQPSCVHAAAGLALIVGLGETGVAAARWCARQGMRLRVLDTRPHPPGLQALQDEGLVADQALGCSRFEAQHLEGAEILVLSPGIRAHEPTVAAFLEAARAKGVTVLGEIELFARALAALAPSGYQPKVLAITGTNGKTTVTALTRDLARAAGCTARAAGNIGPAALTSLLDALDTDDLPDVWVLELSSFQLESTVSLQADAAVVLNVTQDHLDWHGSMAAYAAAKARVYGMAKCRIWNRGDDWVRSMISGPNDADTISFGLDAPHQPGDLGLHVQDGLAWLAACEAPAAAEPAGRRPSSRPQTPASQPVVRDLMPADALQIRGQHNALNALAALALGRAIGLDWAPMLHALRAYGGEAHRTQFVRAVQGVDFIDDSKGTNVGATLAALQGMGRPVVLIAGGQGKGQDFGPLRTAVREHARAVMLIGQDAALLAQVLADTGVPVHLCDTLQRAVQQGFEQARAGDVVLLSPACASLDMFRNYIERGQCFSACVRELAIDQGEVA